MGRIKTHGMTNTHLYYVYRAIIQRCNYTKFEYYKYYGGKGIECLWQTFEEFYKDMGETYKQGLTIDRVDVNGHYCKENCRWVDYKKQAQNRNNNIIIFYNGKTQCLKEWCEELNLPYKTIYKRYKLGYSIFKCFNKPINKGRDEKGRFL